MNSIRKTIFAILLPAVCSITLLSNNNVHAALNHKLSKDSSEQVSREVLTSQQLFMVKMSKGKKTRSGKRLVNFKAELRDAFMIVCYKGDKSFTEQSWRMCPDGKCPVPGTYEIGSEKYKHLDTLMAATKLADIKARKKLVALDK